MLPYVTAVHHTNRANTILLVRCRENGLQNVITLIKGKAEEVTLPVDKVNLN